jgi:uncharacterized protein YqjF (DUF2071 family)
MTTRAAFDWSLLNRTDHRPWPMPSAPWLMTQSWHHLLFAHWPVNAAELRHLVPRAFDIDLFEGQAWLGIVPFYMTNVRLRWTPPLPWLSAFAELNVRTYVRVGDRPGIYFFSFDAGRRLAVAAARRFLNLPYVVAKMSVDATQECVTYDSTREKHPAVFRAEYGPTAAPFEARKGSLEYFLTERYCLYNLNRRREAYRLDIHHAPWALQPARAKISANTMARAAGIQLDGQPALLHFSRRQDMIAWAPTYDLP